ncbi:MAG: hypothetical protein ACI8SI_003453, partial [Congregibacter sp.]
CAAEHCVNSNGVKCKLPTLREEVVDRVAEQTPSGPKLRQETPARPD